MLNFDLRNIERSDVSVSGALQANDPALVGLPQILSEPVSYNLTVSADGAGLVIKGILATAGEFACRRCLAPVRTPVRVPLRLLFRPEVPDDDAGDDVYQLAPQARELDFTPALREQLALALPQLVVCSEECRGLCPGCGADRNQGDCGCERVDDEDSPWVALKSLQFD